MRRNWIAVASANHARRGGAGGFIQVSHGTLAPLKRIAPGDRVAVYSPTALERQREMPGFHPARRVVRAGEPYRADMGGGFAPFRRGVDWVDARDAPIAPLLDALDFTAGKKNWGYQLRFGLFAVSDRDIALGAEAMGVNNFSVIASEATQSSC